MLEAMMDRMGHHRQPSTSPRPPSQAFPTRTSSRASSASRLSNQSSNRSLQSLHSLHSMSAMTSADSPNMRPDSALSRRNQVTSGGDEEEDETTPSISQGEWAAVPRPPHGRSHTAGAMPQRQIHDDSSSLRSHGSREGDSFSGHFYPPSRSVPTSPQARPRPGTSSSAFSASSFERAGSPLRLLPRSPLNERTPLEDLTFFREAGAFTEEEDPWPEGGGDNESIHSVASGGSGRSATLSAGGRASSLRAARLREDIEREAQRIKERSSLDEIRRAAAARPPVPPETPSSSRPSLGERVSGGTSSVPLYPGAPVPSNSAPPLARPSTADLQDDSRSIHSLGSTSVASVTGTWPPPSTSGQNSSSAASINSASGSIGGSASASASGHTSTSASARTEYGIDRGKGRERPRQKESREWSQTCWVWQTSLKAASGSSSGGVGKFSKAPLIRDVPSVMKRKAAKRESAHHLLSPAEAILYNVEDSKGKSSSSSKDKGKGSSSAASAVGREGGWKRATGVLRDDGCFRIFSESDKTVLHSVHIPSLSRTDVRSVDHSLFGRPNCISLIRRQTGPTTPHRTSFQPNSSTSSSSSLYSSLPSSSSSGKSDEPLYLCFPSVVATQVWLVMTQCFARPEYYLASGAATPRPLGKARGGAPPGYPSNSGSDSDPDPLQNGGAGKGSQSKPDELEASCRIYRSVVLTINEGRALGELATEVIRPGPKTSWERSGADRGDLDGGTTSFSSSGGDAYSNEAAPAKPRMQSRPGLVGGGEGKEDGSSETFCEIEMGGEVVARTSVRKGTSPFWNEAFTFSDLPPFLAPITIRVLQSSKHSSRPHLLGSATIRIPDLPRHELVQDWWPIKPANPAKISDIVGELSLGLRIGEEVMLPSKGYQAMLKLLADDSDAELATDIAHEFPSDLEEVTKILLRIYQADGQLVPRLLRLADLEVDGNNRNNRSAAILFRGNTILTKSVELYLRLIGAEYLDASIGEPIRRICAEKVEIEIDPMKLKPGWKEKELQANIHALHDWTLTVWNSIYDAREKCPHDLRQIFGHIQRIVVEKYGLGEEQKNTRWTCVSAFIFLRFFVPAVLNPKLFFIVSSPPDPRSQRTLTLVAKTLQGLANFSSFGQKEPFMLPMNPFVQENTAAFVDFIEHISTAGPATGYRQEWTSPNAAAYLAPYRLRNSLAPLDKEGVPLLPHLIDLPRELGLLASLISRFVAEKGPLVEEGKYAGVDSHPRSETPSIASSRGGRSHRFIELAEACVDVHAESRRRGGGLVATTYLDLRNKTADPQTRTKRALSGRPGTASSLSSASAGYRKSLGAQPPFGRSATAESDELHIRNPAAALSTPISSSPSSNNFHHRQESSEGRESVASRRSHRSFTINSTGGSGFGGTGLSRRGSFPPKSFSTEDLSLLAAISTPREPEFTIRERAHSPPLAGEMTTSATITSFASHLEDQENSFMIDEDEFSALNPGPQEPLFGGPLVPPTPTARFPHPQTVEEYSFPPPRASPAVSSQPVQYHSSSSASTRSTSTTRSGHIVSPTPPLPPATSRIRITQETTTTSTYVSDPSAVLGEDSPGLVTPGEEYDTLAPTSHEEGTPYESSFGGTPFSAPLMRPQTSQTSGRSMTSSLSSMSISAISAEVSASSSPASTAGGSGNGVGGMLGGRRTSSAGLSLGFGLGGRKGSASSGGRGAAVGVEEEGSEAGSGSSGSRKSAGGLLSRAMGRKGSRAS
ncbi:hypothetical protein JCM11641_004595 [Rhodosporidiobolus odoratus]